MHMANKQKTAADAAVQIQRIRQMEKRFVNVSVAVKRLSIALDKYLAAQEAVAVLNDYYGSELWKKDFADDEAGKLPEGLKRGVLSEDGIWNLLDECRELNEQLKETVERIGK